MIALLLALLFAAETPRPTSPSLPPADWSALPALVMIRPTEITPDMSDYVRSEVARNRCAAVHQGTGWRLTVDLAVLVTTEGRVRRIMPRAIQCATVEQYAAGLVQSMARDNVEVTGGDGERWYRTALTFAWAA